MIITRLCEYYQSNSFLQLDLIIIYIQKRLIIESLILKKEMKQQIPQNIVDLIIQLQVGTQKKYNKKLIEPRWYCQQCGINIGIAYDLAFVSDGQFVSDWKQYLSPEQLKVLQQAVGFRGLQAKQICQSIRNVQIPYDAAVKVFKTRTLPKFIRKAQQIFSGCQNLAPQVFGVLILITIGQRTCVDLKELEQRPQILNIKKLITGELSVQQDFYSFMAQQIKDLRKYESGCFSQDNTKRLELQAQLVEKYIKNPKA